jgi:hypothetical protein
MAPGILRIIATFLFCCAAVYAAPVEEAAQPANPDPTVGTPAINSLFAPVPVKVLRPNRDRWIRLGLVWGSTAFDLASTRYALARNPDAREGNPMVSGKNGNLQTGRYLAITLPLNVAATYANLKYPHSKAVRVLTYVTSAVKIGIGVSNLSHSR